MKEERLYPYSPGHREVETSIEAAEAIKEGVETIRNKVFNVILNKGNFGATADEVAELLNFSPFTVRPRVTELFKLDKIDTYLKFEKKIQKIKKIYNKKINSILSLKQKIHGYGASTKGNVILQYFDIDNKKIDFISDRNPFKNNRYTPGTKIKIISEKKSRNLKPNYYFVLPWHFKKEILKREIKIRKKNTKFIFPLPKFYII